MNFKQCALYHRGETADNFCRICGGPMQTISQLPFVGENPTKGTYQITIVANYEFRNQDAAEEAAGKSILGEVEVRFYDLIEKSKGKLEVKFIESTVTKKTHPFVCGTCQKSENTYISKNPYVSHTDQGICENCGEQNWIKRK